MQSLLIVVCSIVAAIVYGILHDQVTARVCLEYFTVGHPRLIASESPTVLALFWGVVATWWVGLPLGIGLALVARVGFRPKLDAKDLIRPIILLLGVMYVAAFVSGVIGFLGAKRGAFILFEPFASRIPPDKHAGFIADLWAHSASYFVGIIGGILLCVFTWRRRSRLLTRTSTSGTKV